jgi:hypothetical protein
VALFKEGKMTKFNLVTLSVVFNFIQIIIIVLLLKKLAKYKDAIKKIDGIVSGLKKQPPPPRDPRKGMEWNIKR